MSHNRANVSQPTEPSGTSASNTNIATLTEAQKTAKAEADARGLHEAIADATEKLKKILDEVEQRLTEAPADASAELKKVLDSVRQVQKQLGDVHGSYEKSDQSSVKKAPLVVGPVDNKTLESAEKLLRVGGPDQTKRSIKWDEFERFMKKMGFTVDPSTAGSSVRFDPPDETQRSITFHKPWPDATIDHIHVHLFGKKLREWYGWGEEDLQRLRAGTRST